MVNRKGSAATMMSALANADINIKAIAQVGGGCGGAGLGGSGQVGAGVDSSRGRWAGRGRGGQARMGL